MLNKAWNTGYNTRTENGMPTPVSSMSYLVDMFFKMGAMRAKPDTELTNMFMKAYTENPLYAVRALFYNRDVRGGQGERRSFRVMFKWLCVNAPEVAMKVLHFVPEYGRWDDLQVTLGTNLEECAYQLILAELEKGNKLCAKWMPRENKKGYDTWGKGFINYTGLTERNYRKLLAGNTQVVENLMCKKFWSEINYSQVPSVASNKYRKAFYKQDAERYSKFVELAKAGKVKVNASAIFPSDIVKKVFRGVSKVESDSIDAQWSNLPNYVPEGKSFIPMCDVSGSMSGDPILVCLALGIYLAERNKGKFHNLFLTFSGKPELQEIKGDSLRERVANLNRAHWEMNTNLELAFQTLLERAKRFGLPQEEMPSNILIMSDMQFDQATREPKDTAYNMIKRQYEEAGYKMPGVVFWNLRASTGVPVSYTQNGTALVSGYSPSIMKTVLSGELNPLAVVVRTLDSKRYNCITF